MQEKSKPIDIERESYKSTFDAKSLQISGEKSAIDKIEKKIKILKIKVKENEIKSKEHEGEIIENSDHLEMIGNKLEHAQLDLETAELELIKAKEILEDKKEEKGYNKAKKNYDNCVARTQVQFDSINSEIKNASERLIETKKPNKLAADFKNIVIIAVEAKLKALTWDKKKDGTSASMENNAGILYAIAKLEGLSGKGKAYTKNKCVKAGWGRDSKSGTIFSAPENCHYSKAAFQQLVYETYKEVMTNGNKMTPGPNNDPFPGFGAKVGQILKVPVKENVILAKEPNKSIKSTKPK